MVIINEETNQDSQPWKFIYQNMRGLVSENSRRKIDYFNEFVEENKIIILNFTETWLTDTVQDEAKISGFNEYRGDRKDCKQGGTAIYLNTEIEGFLISSFSQNKCEMVAIRIPSLNLVNIVTYRPPHTKINDFNPLIVKIREILNSLERPDPTIVWTGDFNFPFVEWKECDSGGSIWDFNTKMNACADEREQFRNIMNLASNFNLIQLISEPTRGNNTLDLIFTNEIDLFSSCEISHSALSDHFLIEMSTSIKTDKKDKKENNNEKDGLRKLNFYSDKINWEEIIKELSNIDWQNLLKDTNTHESTMILNKIINEICLKYIPLKRKHNGKKKIPKIRKQLIGRLKMLRRTKRKSYSKEKIDYIMEKIVETEQKLIENRRKERLEKEKSIIENVPRNPKLLFAYAKKENNRKRELGPFKKDGDFIHNDDEICSMLVDEYKKQFTEKSQDTDSELAQEIMNTNEEDLINIIFKESDLEDAINILKENSAPGPDEIPAIFMKITSKELAKPMAIILKKSIERCEIPDIYKMAHITPIHKGGKKCKYKPENYRPVSLTSHIMKVYERIIAKNIIKHLTKNQLFNENQHGFVPGKSTQTQLLLYYKDIFESLKEGIRIDTVFLDFARAFDKVNHEILMKKIVKHKIKGKVAMWLKEFLYNRKFRVVANNVKSKEEEVTSGVPQGTVLAALLFIIMISDIDENIRESIVRCFADDTRNSKRIEKEEDIITMQKDLDTIYEWSNTNKMKFNIEKFEQISHGEIIGVPNEPYKNPEGDDIVSDSTIKDLGVICNNNLKFKEHIEEIVMKSKIMSGLLLRTFITREEGPMLQLFNSYIRSRLEYCSIVWSPTLQGDINKIERIQKSFTSKIEGMENKNYHQRLKALNLYSLERRRECYLIINAWEQIEGKRENILNLSTRRTGRCRKIILDVIRWSIRGKKLRKAVRTQIHNSTTSKMSRLFNILPAKLANIEGVTTDTFKHHLDKWLQTIPDEPRIDNYSKMVEKESNSLLHQVATRAAW